VASKRALKNKDGDSAGPLIGKGGTIGEI